MTYPLHRIVKNAQLWRVAVLKNDFESAIVINICERERAAIFREVQSCGSGNFREGAIPVSYTHLDVYKRQIVLLACSTLPVFK